MDALGPRAVMVERDRQVRHLQRASRHAGREAEFSRRVEGGPALPRRDRRFL